MRRIAIWLVSAVAGLAFAWLWLVPTVLEHQALRILARLGFHDARLRVERVAFDAVELTGVELGERAPLRIERVRISFKLREVLQGRVQEVSLEDARWSVRLGGGLPPPFEDLRQAPASSMAGPALALPDLGVSRLHLRRGRIRLPAASEEVELACEAELVADANTWRATFAANARDQVLAGSAELQQVASVARGEVNLSLGERAAPVRLAGTATVTALTSGRAVTLELTSSQDPVSRIAWAGRSIEVQGASLRAAVSSTPELGGRTSTCEIGLSTPADGRLTLHGDAWAALEGMVVRGTLHAHGEMGSASSSAGSASLQVAEIDVRGAKNAWHGDGIDLALSLTGLRTATLQSPAAQVLRWRSVAVGELEAGSGSLTFQIVPGPLLQVAGARWAVDDAGSMSTGAFSVDPAQPDLTIRLAMDNAPLRPWLDVMSQGRVTGGGRLTGWLESRLCLAPAFAVELRGGHLQSSESGVIRFMDDPETQAMLESHAARIAEESGQDRGTLQKRIVASLKDFAFDDLSFDLVSSGKGLDLKTHVAGKGRNIPQELDLTINLHGFDALVDLAVGAKLGLERAQRRLVPRQTKGQ